MDSEVKQAIALHRAKRWKMPRARKGWVPGAKGKAPSLRERAVAETDRAALDASLARKGEDETTCKRVRALELEEARGTCKLARAKLKTACADARQVARARGADCLTAADRKHQDALALYWRDQDVRRRVEAPRRRRGEGLAESDDSVRTELELTGRARLVPIWNRVRTQFKGTPHERWERFEEWLEHNHDEVTLMLDALAPGDSEHAAAERAYREAQGLEPDPDEEPEHAPRGRAPSGRRAERVQKALSKIEAAAAAAEEERGKAHAFELAILDATELGELHRPRARLLTRWSAIGKHADRARAELARLHKLGAPPEALAAAAAHLERIRDHAAYVYGRYTWAQNYYPRAAASEEVPF